MKKLGFTLAEVLITLGIIGVVAALTMPTLIANYKKQVLVTQLKKTVSTLQNGIRLVNASEGIDDIFNSPYGNYNIFGDQNQYISVNIDSDKFAQFLKFDIPDETYKLNISGGEIELPYRLKSGAYLYLSASCYDDYKKDSCSIDTIIDVNGPKAPNRAGRDLFTFALLPDGRINTYIVSSYVDGEMEKLCKETSSLAEEMGIDEKDFEETKASACFYQIVRDGWKMDY